MKDIGFYDYIEYASLIGSEIKPHPYQEEILKKLDKNDKIISQLVSKGKGKKIDNNK